MPQLTLFRRGHARLGAKVSYYEPGKGAVHAELIRVSYTRNTVWIHGEDGLEVGFSKRNDGTYRRQHGGPSTPALEYVLDPNEDAGVDAGGPFTRDDYTRSTMALKELLDLAGEMVPRMVPEDYAQLKDAIGKLHHRTEKYSPSLDGRRVAYRAEAGEVVRSSDRSVWVRFPSQGELMRFSRRPDGKYRETGRGNFWAPLEFIRDDQEADPTPAAAAPAPEMPKLGKDAIHLPPAQRDPRTAASVAKRQAAIAAREAAERAAKEEQEGWDLI